MLAGTRYIIFQQSSSRRKAASVAAIGATRFLMVHEYVAMDLMKRFGINTPKCYVVSSPTEARTIFETKLCTGSQGAPSEAILKAQVLTGGRGKGRFDNDFQGGVHMVKSPEQAEQVAAKMIGARLHTQQAPQGLPTNKLLIRECFELQNELYISIMWDITSQDPVVMASSCGGVDIEEAASKTPNLIFHESIDLYDGPTDDQCWQIAKTFGYDPSSKLGLQTRQLVRNMYRMFLESDCTQIEINPLSQTKGEQLVVCDAKVSFDDRAKDRQPCIFKERDESQEDPREVFASEHRFNYVRMNGDVGCMVNGAGLSMATMDLLASQGGKPACFLDVGGACCEVEVQAAFEVMDTDEQVKSILINVFGGIVKCDMVAEGLIEAIRNRKSKKPVVIRLEGTNAKAGLDMLAQSGLPIVVENDWTRATSRAIALAKNPKLLDTELSHACFEGISDGMGDLQNYEFEIHNASTMDAVSRAAAVDYTMMQQHELEHRREIATEKCLESPGSTHPNPWQKETPPISLLMKFHEL